MSYAEAAQSKKIIPDANKQVPLLIKPKAKQNSEKTKEELNKKVNPVNFKIINVENRRDGALIIQSENKEERDKIKTAIQNELSDGYEIKVPNPAEFFIDITDITFKYSDEELTDKLKRQNPIMNNCEIKIIKKYEYRRNSKTIYNVKIILDSESYTKVINAQKLNIGWERCRVVDGTEIKRCFKCKGLNHSANDCRNKEMCFKCHGCHRSRECDKEPINRCINCVKMNQKLNMGLDEKHGTYSKECPVYQNKLKMRKKKMGLTY